VEGPSMELEVFSAPVKVKKFNSGRMKILKWQVLETIEMSKH
jgi:hypothetical protein